MSHDGVAAVDHTGVVTALVEHAQVAAQHAGEVHVAVHGAFVRADHGELTLVEGDLRVLLQQAFQHLIGRHGVVEAHQRHSILHAGVMCVEGDDVLHTHGLQLLQGHGAVQALTHHAAMLTAAVQAGHDHRHAVCLAGHRLDQALQVCKVIVRGHVVHVVKQLVGHAVVAGIHHNKDIVAAHGLLDQTLGITALEAGAVAGDDEGLLVNAGVLGPTDQVLVDQAGKLLGTGASDQPHVCHTGLLEKRLGGNFNGHNHNSLLLLSNPNDLRTNAHIYFYFITI